MENGNSHADDFPDDDSDDGSEDETSLSDWNLRKVNIFESVYFFIFNILDQNYLLMVFRIFFFYYSVQQQH